ncbi:ankyrin repeat domain-containing protein [Noviherbaspirillum pedocola]|uniref:Ankyrin repeat domain-containing protein n=1 Tax=Noviherbaspirillum pedocola TaxID=2801341 RepID=A0A934W887_9BURK|nr:ankyrin repeat domain-containing protein [Noviherbaspirillum pedocola]MBK4738327.1 ankyrin repeat domain-containing protein [Noviherbaspirillum pedocola]
MKRSASSSAGESNAGDGHAMAEQITNSARQAARGGTPEQAVLPDAPAEGTSRPSVNAASPQGRRVLTFTLGGMGGRGHGAIAFHERIGALPYSSAAAGPVIDPLPQYVPPPKAPPTERPIPAQVAAPGASRAAMSEHAFACWRHVFPAVTEIARVDFAEFAARHVREGMDAWLNARLKLEEDQRIRFLMESLPHVIEANWSAAVALIFREAPLDRLQRMVWPRGCRLAHLALRFGDKELVRTVLAQHAVKDALTDLDRDGMTPLHLAVAADDAEATGTMLNCHRLADALVLKPNRDGWLPIHLAARAGAERAGRHLLLRQQLIQRSATVGGDQRTIHIAAMHGRTRLVKMLLAEHAQSQLCAVDANKRNALMHAVRWGASGVVKELLAVSSALHAQLFQRDVDDLNALQHAQAAGNQEVLGQIEAAMRKAFPESEQAPLWPMSAPTPQGGEDEKSALQTQEAQQ